LGWHYHLEGSSHSGGKRDIHWEHLRGNADRSHEYHSSVSCSGMDSMRRVQCTGSGTTTPRISTGNTKASSVCRRCVMWSDYGVPSAWRLISCLLLLFAMEIVSSTHIVVHHHGPVLQLANGCRGFLDSVITEFFVSTRGTSIYISILSNKGLDIPF
jgi:hypothetical protein